MKKIFSKLSRKWRKRIKIGGILSVFFFAAVLLAKPAYRVFRDWRVENNASEATEALAAGNYTVARRLAMSVLRLQDDRHDMLLVLQRSMDALNDPGAVNISRMLMAHPDATEEDHIRGFQVICSELPLATTAGIWMSMDPEKANSPPYLAAYTERLIDQDLPNEAARLLLNRMDLEREPELRLQAIRALITMGQSEQLERAQLEISEMMEEEGKWAISAFRLLAMVPAEQFRSAYFPELEEWVKRKEGATIDDQLLAVTQRFERLKEFPGQAETIAQGAIDNHSEADPAAVARWLIQVGMAEKALELLPSEECLTDEERYRARARALIDLERWQDARKWLAEAPDSFPLVELHAMRVISDDTPGDPTRNGKAWGLALKNAGSNENPNDYLELHDRMREAGLDELAKEAMVEAVSKGRGRLPLWVQVRDLLPWLRAKKDGPAMLNLCSTMADLEPTNIEVVIEALDLACIFGRATPSDLVEKLWGFQEQIPGLSKAPKFIELMATAQLAAKQPAEALATLNGAQDKAGASGRVVVVAAVSNALLGEENISSELLARVDWKQMYIEEKEFFTAQLDSLSESARTEASAKTFEKNTEPKELPGISDAVEAMFKPKELPPIEVEKDE